MPSLWATTPLAERLDWVASFRRRVARAERDLCDAVRQDTGKERFECLTGDIAPLLASCRWVERNAARLLAPHRLGSAPFWMSGTRIRVLREPVGRVAIIATWNYPLQLLGIQLVHALAAGNTVRVKPSERSPRSQRMLLEMAAADLPEGTLEWTGPERDEGPRLLAGERFDHVVFTGSTPVGREVAANLATSLTRCTLELSGRDSAFVLHDASPKLAARSIWGAVCLNAGQSCMAPRRALVHEAVYEEFCRSLSAVARKTAARPLVDAAMAARCAQLAKDAIDRGGRDAAGMGAPAADGVMLRPVAVLDCPREAELIEGRHFGPAIAVVRVADTGEALELHRRSDQHLTASVFTTKPARVAKLVPHLGATSVMINDCIIPAAHPEASIGGRGESGLGLSRGEAGLLEMTRAVYVSRSSGLMGRSLSKPPGFVVGMLAKVLRWTYGR